MKRICSLVLTLAMALSLAACGGGTAATMHLRRTQGTVSVSDGGGKDIPVLENLGLYSGYGVGTRAASYAWIDLDEVKLVKLDQNSEIAIEKEGKALNIEIKSGSLFFNVTEPLEDDETMNIRTSTMLVGIRGTRGWVEENNGLSRVYILEGQVECSAGGQTVQVKVGEMARLTADGELTVETFDSRDFPAFVREEVYNPDTDPGFFSDPFTESSDAPESPEPSGGPEGDALTSGSAGENVKWSFRDGTLTISGTGDMEDFRLTGYDPDGKNLYSMPWYDHCAEIGTVIIEDGVTGIGSYAFASCTNLTDVTIPDSVVSIGKFAFDSCTSLTGVTIPDSVVSIEMYAFQDVPWLESLGEFAVVNGILIAYQGEGGDVVIPDSVTSIGERAFVNYWYLYTVTIPDTVTTIGSEAFIACPFLREVTIGNGVASIKKSAFEMCDELVSITIPASVTSIEYSAFDGCIRLRDVNYGGSEIQWEEIDIDTDGNYSLLHFATIHYNSTGN